MVLGPPHPPFSIQYISIFEIIIRKVFKALKLENTNENTRKQNLSFH